MVRSFIESHHPFHRGRLTQVRDSTPEEIRIVAPVPEHVVATGAEKTAPAQGARLFVRVRAVRAGYGVVVVDGEGAGLPAGPEADRAEATLSVEQ